MEYEVETRLTRAGLSDTQLQAVSDEYDNLTIEGKSDFRNWLNTVHDDDIKERYGTEAATEIDAGGTGGPGF